LLIQNDFAIKPGRIVHTGLVTRELDMASLSQPSPFRLDALGRLAGSDALPGGQWLSVCAEDEAGTPDRRTLLQRRGVVPCRGDRDALELSR
jgi:hypothetical protein